MRARTAPAGIGSVCWCHSWSSPGRSCCRAAHDGIAFAGSEAEVQRDAEAPEHRLIPVVRAYAGPLRTRIVDADEVRLGIRSPVRLVEEADVVRGDGERGAVQPQLAGEH